MLHDSKAFSGFSVDDIAVAKEFYATTLGLDVGEENGMLHLQIAGWPRDPGVSEAQPRPGGVHRAQLPGDRHRDDRA